MTQSSPLRPRDRSLHPGFIWAGLALYGAANFGMYAAGAIGEPLGAALFPAAVAAAAALTYWVLRWRGAAIGIVVAEIVRQVRRRR